MGGEGLGQSVVCGIVLRGDEEAAGILIDAVDDARPLFAADAVQIASDGIAALRLPTLARGLYFVEIHTTSRTTKTQLMVL